MAARNTLDLVAALLDGSGRGWPAEVRSAAEVIVDAAAHDDGCLTCPRLRLDAGLLAEVRGALAGPYRGSDVDEQLGAALAELAAEVERRPRRCAASVPRT